MKATKMVGKKRLSAMMAAAFSFGAAFSLTPSDALAATVEITQVGTNYVFTEDGTSRDVLAKDFAAEFNKVAGTANNEITVTGGARGAIAGIADGVKLAPGTTLTVNKPWDTNYVTLKNGAKESTLKVTGSGVTGTDVNLDSLKVQATGQSADVNLTGNVRKLTMTGESNVTLNTPGDGTLKVASLNVKGTSLNGAAKVEAATANLKGATLNGTQLKADTVTVDAGTTFDKDAKVTATTVKVNNDTAAAVADLINKGTIAPAADKLNVNTSAVTDATLKDNLKKLPNVAATDVKSSYDATDFAGGKLTLDGKEYAGKDLAAGITEAFKKGAERITLDTDTVQKITQQVITIPADKVLALKDGTDQAVVKTAKDTVVELKDGKVNAKSGALASIRYDVTPVPGDDKTINADLSDLDTVGDVTVTSGIVNLGEKVTAKRVWLGADATILAKTLKAEELRADDLTKALKNITTLAAADGNAVKLKKTNGDAYTEADFKNLSKEDQEKILKKIPGNQKLQLSDKAIAGTGENYWDYPKFDPKKPIESLGKILAQDYEGEKTAKQYRDEVGDKVTALNATSVTATFAYDGYDPFTDDVAIANKTQIDNVLKTTDYTTEQLQEFHNRFEYLTDVVTEDYAKKELPFDYLVKVKDLVDEALKAETKAARAKAIAALNAEQASTLAYQTVEKGKIAAGAGVSASRTANVINDVIAGNIANRTADLRAGELAAAAPTRAEGTPNNLWFQIRHSNQDVETSSTGYADSKVKATTYQLGYDYQLSDTDYLGLYLASTTGSADFNGVVSGSANIKSSLDGGLYGTHVLTNGQYLDYYLHKGKFSLDHVGVSAKTDDFGAMVGYGVKIRNSEDLIVNPYINFAYDKLSFDTYSYPNGNTISADDQTNFTTKLGVNFDWTSGLTAGIAYSRGFSGSYNPYINGVALPGVDNDYNVFYLSLGYKNYLNPTTYLNVSVDKTFADYKGWIASGRVNFFF